MMQYYTESRKERDAQLGATEVTKNLGATNSKSSALPKPAEDAALAVTPSRQTSQSTNQS